LLTCSPRRFENKVPWRHHEESYFCYLPLPRFSLGRCYWTCACDPAEAGDAQAIEHGGTVLRLGVVVLSEMVASSASWKRISVDVVAPFVLWLHTIFPVAAFLGASLTRGPSSGVVSTFAIGFWGYTLIPLMFLNETVAFPRLRALRSTESRWRYFGLLLLLSGVGLQLIAAVIGLETR
jgi:hypothetical protein